MALLVDRLQPYQQLIVRETDMLTHPNPDKYAMIAPAKLVGGGSGKRL